MTDVDERRIKERIQTLRVEIAEVKRASSLFVRKRHQSAQEFRDQDKRMIRLKQLLKELASLLNRKRETK